MNEERTETQYEKFRLKLTAVKRIISSTNTKG